MTRRCPLNGPLPVLLRLLLVGLLLLLSGCQRCSRAPLAELGKARGEVSRDHASAFHQWEKAPVGAEFQIGDGVRTGKRSEATVVFDDGTHVALKESTTVRFLETEPGSSERGLKVESGEVTVGVQKAQLLLRTDVGLARLEPGSIVRIGRGKRGVRFFVKVGRAHLESVGGRAEHLAAGQGVEVTVGLAVVEHFGDQSAEAAPAALAAPSREQAAAAALEKEPIVASVSGPGAQAQSAGQDTWSSLPKGETTLSPGTKLRLRKGSSTTVRRGAQSAQLDGPGDYLVEGSADRFVTLLSGITILTADGMDVGMDAAGGSVVAQGSRERSVAEVSVRANKLASVTVRQGSVVVNFRGKQETLRPGESLRIAPEGDHRLFGRGVAFADVVLAAGNSLSVHDPDPPTAVGFTFSKDCPDRAIVELGAGGSATSAAGRREANLRVSAGRHSYRVRCLGEEGPDKTIAARGTVTVFHDPGTAPLAAGAPSTLVDTDGRSYTVLYQNRLPKVTVRWPHPPEAASYVLVHQSPVGTRSVPTRRPSYAFPSGAVVEGRHVLTFQAGDKQSRPTAVTVRFDPAAPKASINSPPNAGFAPNSTVQVSGMALPGWRVFAGATELTLDAQHRFSGSATAGDRVLLIRFQHPSRGSELYLRRAAGVPR